MDHMNGSSSPISILNELLPKREETPLIENDISNRCAQVTAVMVTQPSRLEMAREAIDCFHRQSYASKGLLIVVEDQAYAQRLRELSGEDVLLVKDANNLGDLRNRAIEAVREGLLIQWDDDDLYGERRIELQAEPLNQHPHLIASYLASQTVTIEGCSYHRFVSSGIVGTIMHRSNLPFRYPSIKKREDTIFSQLIGRGAVAVVRNPPETYVRRYHGTNTWGLEHFKMIRGRAMADPELSRPEPK